MTGNISLGFTVCILALLCTLISPASLEKRPAGHLPDAPQFQPRDVLKSVVQINPPFYDPECQVGGCTFSYESVSLFYWPSVAPTNTACLATLASPPVVTPPAGLSMQSPSVYVIFTSFYLYDGCGTKLLQASFDLTTSFASGELSTVATAPGGGLSTDAFDFDDLPCPPPGVQVEAGQPYRPLLAPPAFVTALPGWNPNFDNCDPGHGIDPPTALTSALGGLPGPGFPGMPLPPRDVRAYAHPHMAPRAPTKTAGPA